MVWSCILCKDAHIKALNISFHRFPANSNLRSTWCRILGLNLKCVGQHTVLCSNHFSSKDFILKPSGLRQLKQDALPCKATTSNSEKPKSFKRNAEVIDSDGRETEDQLTNQAKKLKLLTDSSANPVVQSQVLENVPYPSTNVDICLDTDVSSSESEEENVATSANKKTSSFNAFDSSATESGSESENIFSPGLRTAETQSEWKLDAQERRKRLPRYVGDCTLDDINNPNTSQRAWQIIKDTISKQNKKLRELSNENRMLKSRVVCLKSLVKYLKENYFFTENKSESEKCTD